MTETCVSWSADTVLPKRRVRSSGPTRETVSAPERLAQSALSPGRNSNNPPQHAGLP